MIQLWKSALYAPVSVEFTVNWRNWALPLAFGGGAWEDQEIGDYGARYGCDYYRGFVIHILCLRMKVEWSVE